MKIKSLKIKNFRGYKDCVEMNFDALTVFVGKNDVGKSTILEALDIFFNDGKGVVKIDKSDVNVQAACEGDFETEIAVCFTDLPSKIVIDSSVETTLDSEHMLNKDGCLEVVKKYKNGGAAKVFLSALHPSNSKCSNLLLKKNADLKKIVNDENIKCENHSINSMLRHSIWKHFENELDLIDTEIDVSKEDAKRIWEKLIVYMPVYSLFQSDRKNCDSDDEVQDPLKEAVKQILMYENLQKRLSEIATEVETELKKVSGRTLDKLREMDESVADSLNPVIPSADSLKWSDVFKNVSICGDENIPINKRGSGVKRLILLNFFRAEAEKRLENKDGTGVIYAVEEPETSQHSNNQRMLIESFKKLSKTDNTQVILTTHSPIVVKELEFDNLRLIQNKNTDIKEVCNVAPGQLRYPSLNEVNYLAFNEITEEYHDELYGYIDFMGWRKDYTCGRKTKPYNKICKDGKVREESLMLTEYIRHQIHHPENKHNIRYTRNELKESIDLMRNFIQNKGKSNNM